MQVEKCWVIKAGNEFVGIHSNGHFHYTSFWKCEKFSSLENAKEYAGFDWGRFKNCEWEIYATDEVGLKFIQGEPDTFEEELAELKRKHGRV